MTTKVEEVLLKKLIANKPFTGFEVAKEAGEKSASMMVRESFNNGGKKWAGWAATQADTMPGVNSFRPKGPLVYFPLMDGYSDELYELLKKVGSPWAEAPKAEKPEKKEEPKKSAEATEIGGRERFHCKCGKSYSRNTDLTRHKKIGGADCG